MQAEVQSGAGCANDSGRVKMSPGTEGAVRTWLSLSDGTLPILRCI